MLRRHYKDSSSQWRVPVDKISSQDEVKRLIEKHVLTYKRRYYWIFYLATSGLNKVQRIKFAFSMQWVKFLRIWRP